MFAFFIDLGADASAVAGDLVVKIDQRLQTLAVNSSESLSNAELCGLSTSRDKLTSYYLTVPHDRIQFNVQI